MKVKGNTPPKHQIEDWLREVCGSFSSVYYSHILSNAPFNEYTARVCCDTLGVITVTHKHWDYDKLILDIEEILLKGEVNE